MGISKEGAMIARTWRGATAGRDADAYLAHLRAES